MPWDLDSRRFLDSTVGGVQNDGVAVPRISREDLKARLEDPDPTLRPVLLDARLKYPYEHSTLTLPGALRALGTDLPPLPPGREIIVYDSDPDELACTPVASRLLAAGHTVFALKGGIVDWIAAGYPTEGKSAPKGTTPEPGSLKG